MSALGRSQRSAWMLASEITLKRRDDAIVRGRWEILGSTPL